MLGRAASQIFGEVPYLEAYAQVVERGEPMRLSGRFEPMQRDFAITVFSPAPGQFATVFQDVTEHRRAEERIRQLAFHDTLTLLPNRRLLADRMRMALPAVRRHGGRAALMFLDLDHFKALNDKEGHNVGDQLLVEAAGRLMGSVRATDTVARFGGDEFVILLVDLDADAAQATAQAGVFAAKILATLDEPFVLTRQPAGSDESEGGVRNEHTCSASIGVVVFGSEAVDPEQILQVADAAMYRAKAAGRNQAVVDADLGPPAWPAPATQQVQGAVGLRAAATFELAASDRRLSPLQSAP